MTKATFPAYLGHLYLGLLKSDLFGPFYYFESTLPLTCSSKKGFDSTTVSSTILRRGDFYPPIYPGHFAYLTIQLDSLLANTRTRFSPLFTSRLLNIVTDSASMAGTNNQHISCNWILISFFFYLISSWFLLGFFYSAASWAFSSSSSSSILGYSGLTYFI